MINETQNTEVTTPVSQSRTPPIVPSSGPTPKRGVETKVQLIPWCFPAHPLVFSCSSLGVFLLSFTVDRGWGCPKRGRSCPGDTGTRLRSSQQLPAFSPRVCSIKIPTCLAECLGVEQQEGYPESSIRQYRTCQGAAGLQRRPRRGCWRWFWGTRRAWGAWPAASPAGPP